MNCHGECGELYWDLKYKIHVAENEAEGILGGYTVKTPEGNF